MNTDTCARHPVACAWALAFGLLRPHAASRQVRPSSRGGALNAAPPPCLVFCSPTTQPRPSPDIATALLYASLPHTFTRPPPSAAPANDALLLKADDPQAFPPPSAVPLEPALRLPCAPFATPAAPPPPPPSGFHALAVSS
ncbi:GAF domain-containing protein [Besnoitia besnoiti]|uniref:GAF domain-containing protein n=1 Tax=Besnoitia besnoiti TaxID=94643 RepID=A0A2A9MI40_BESBE|nr:GAF domain-containing protein [Besnoitia besnoiti]PFH38208.1 GAF domain-containing protein [Besnoitia besnoiti]